MRPIPLTPPLSGTAIEALGLPLYIGGVVKARPGVHRCNPPGSFVSPGAPLLPSGP